MNSRRFATALRRVLPLRVAPHSPFQTICGEHTQGGRAKTKSLARPPQRDPE